MACTEALAMAAVLTLVKTGTSTMSTYDAV